MGLSPRGPLSLLVACLLLPGCEEHLPGYERPEYVLSASIHIQARMILATGVPLGPVGVDLHNDSEGVDENVFPAPYELEISLSIWREDEPAHRALVSRKQLFEGVQSHIGPGEFMRVEIEIPMTDDQGFAWSWHVGEDEEQVLLFQGTVRITDLGLELHTPSSRCTFIFLPPGERPGSAAAASTASDLLR